MLRALPATMKSPRDRRPSIWLEGVLQVCVTRTCDMACVNCTQGSNFAGKKWFMTPEQYRVALESLISPTRYFGVIGMFGGNPALHPQFGELCSILRELVPFEQRGLWCNHPRGNAKHCRVTFNPKHSNLNVHLCREAYDEFVRGWPECRDVIKGLDPSWPEAQQITNQVSRGYRIGDARHSPVYGPVCEDEDTRWEKIGRCDVNQFWSAIINVFRGELRGFFCEIAGAMAVLHQEDPDWPDLGSQVVPGWWNQPMDSLDFGAQARRYCGKLCSFPERGFGELAIGGKTNQVSAEHAAVCIPKRKDQLVQVVASSLELHPDALTHGTDYIQNGGQQ